MSESIDKIELEEGEYLCDKCNGSGAISIKDSFGNWFAEICSKCWGKKKLDWIEMATGAEIPEHRHIYGSSGYGYSTSGTGTPPNGIQIYTTNNTNGYVIK